MDLESLSLAELKQLKKRVDAAIEDFGAREERRKLAEIEAFAKERGMTLADIAKVTGKKSRKSVAPKYANPADASQTWTGRGRRPRWVQEAIDGGKTLDDLAL